MSDFERLDTHPPTEKIIPIESELPRVRDVIPDIETPMRTWQTTVIENKPPLILMHEKMPILEKQIRYSKKKSKCQK